MAHRFLIPLAVVGSVGLAAAFMPTLADAATAGSSTPAAARLEFVARVRRTAEGAAGDADGARSGERLALCARGSAGRAGRHRPEPRPRDNSGRDSAGTPSALGQSRPATVGGYTLATSEVCPPDHDPQGDGTATNCSNINTTSPDFSHVYASTGVYSLTVTISDGEGDSASDTWGELQTEGSEYTPYVPTRLLDHRARASARRQAGSREGHRAAEGRQPADPGRTAHHGRGL